jgi:hypothetical protein
MRLECGIVVVPVELFAANGNVSLNCLSQPRGQPQFKTLLHKLMTGEIRVADLDIDVSEVTQ